MIGKISDGNFLISAATLFCGQTSTPVDQLADYMNLNFIEKSTFYTIQPDVLMPVVEHTSTSSKSGVTSQL